MGALMEVGPLNQDTAIAVKAARNTAERIREQDPAEVFRLYNDNPADRAGHGLAGR